MNHGSGLETVGSAAKRRVQIWLRYRLMDTPAEKPTLYLSVRWHTRMLHPKDLRVRCTFLVAKLRGSAIHTTNPEVYEFGCEYW